MATQQEVIQAFMKSLDNATTSGMTALNDAIKACSNFGNVQKIINRLISDCNNATNADSFLKEKCGIDLDNDDTGAITGSDAGGSKIKTAESIVTESGKASYPSSTVFTKRGLTVVVPKKSTLTKAQQVVVQGLYSWWIDEALNLIEKSYGYSFTDSDATVKKITLKFVDESDITLAYVNYKEKSLQLVVNMNSFKNITAKDINGSEETAPYYLDRLIAHELTHAIMAAKIDNFLTLPNFIIEGMAELTHGGDDIRTADIKDLVANPSQLHALLNDTSVTANYAAGYIFLRYFAKQVSEGNDTLPASPLVNDSIDNAQDGVTIQTFGGKDTVKNHGLNVSIGTDAGNDNIHNFGDKMTLDGGAGNDSISNSGTGGIIFGGAGNDYIVNEGAMVSINGGSGSDGIKNDGDKATIDSGAGIDRIVNNGNNVSINGGKGNDTIYTDESNSVTIRGGTGNDSLRGGNRADKIYGGDGLDTLIGGGGNDSLWGNAGADTFIYNDGDGKDVIYGFAQNDLLQITGTFSASYSKSKAEVYFKVGSTAKAITLHDFTATTFHINDDTYEINDKNKFVKK